MKINKIILVACWILSLVAISFYGGVISYGLFFTFTLIPIISLIYLTCVYYRFRIYQHLDTKTPVCNQTIPFYFTLQNEDKFTFSGISVVYYTTLSTINDLEDSVEYELLPNTGITKNTTLVCKYRGEYEVGIKYVEIQDMFRLFKIRYKNPSTIKVEVKPELIHLSELKSVDLRNLIEYESNRGNSERDVLARKYVVGDDIRQINWKLTASKREVMVRGLVGKEQQGIGILLSTNRLSENQTEYLPIENKMLEIAIALTFYFNSNNTPVTNYYLKNDIEDIAVDGLEKFEAYYNAMSAVSFREDHKDDIFFGEIARMETVYTNKIVFFILNNWNEAAKNMACLLNQNGVAVVAYVVSDEKTEYEKTEQMVSTQIMSVSPEDKLVEVM